jgi:hypothetical protein
MLHAIDDELDAAQASLDAAPERLADCGEDSDLDFERIVLAHLATEARDGAADIAGRLLDMEGGPLTGDLHAAGRARFTRAQRLVDTSTAFLDTLDTAIAECRRTVLLDRVAHDRYLALRLLNPLGWEMHKLSAMSELVAALAAFTAARDHLRTAMKTVRLVLQEPDLPDDVAAQVTLTRKELAWIDRRAVRALQACAHRLVTAYIS